MPPKLLPADAHNAELLANAHPPGWTNPTPGGTYDLVAIGGGTAGIISALGAAGLGGKAALVERHLLGGDCLNYGCVPSKAIIRAARALSESERGSFTFAMERMRQLRARISHHDSAQRFTSLGVDVFLADARFTGPASLEVAGQKLKFKRCVIATGARAARPDIPGLQAAGYLTNETVFSLTELPRRLIVIGGGPVGCELAQAFRRFGSSVDLVTRGIRLLPKDDPAAAEVIEKQFAREGIVLHPNAKTLRAQTSAGGKELVIAKDGQEVTLTGDAILVAVGRSPNVEGLGLEEANVEYGPRGVEVDDFLQTSNRRVFAAGDIIGSHQFTHAADAMARLCIQNAFFSTAFFGRKRLSKLVIPWTTYTSPEVAHVGLTPAMAAEQGIEITSYREELSRVDRAILDGEEAGFAVIHCRRGTGNVLGGTIVAAHAGELIGELCLLITRRQPLSALAATIHCYPTQAEVLKRLGDQYNKSRLTPRVAGLLSAILRWRS
jgi:pyruvate/2-oxoglutarate dehydrogenase complex dihydrolipoamide dehydrogenase (E3) component